MPTWLITWGLRALLAAAVAGAIWYGIDQVAAAFRERKQLRYDLGEAREAQASAAALASLLEQRNKAELLLRDTLSKAAADRAARIQKDLTNAQHRLSAWAESADAELSRCLRLPLPRWLLDGTDEAGPPGRILQQADAPAG